MIISDSDITYTNSGLFNGEDRGGRFVFQARIFRLLMPCLRLTVVLRPGIAAGITTPVIVDGNNFVMSVDSIGYATVIFYHGNPLTLSWRLMESPSGQA